jgi:hypothetical protein
MESSEFARGKAVYMYEARQGGYTRQGGCETEGRENARGKTGYLREPRQGRYARQDRAGARGKAGQMR